MSFAWPTALNSCRADTSSRPLASTLSRSSPRPEATAPDEIMITSMPASRSAATWSTSALMRVKSNVPSRRVSTLLPIFTVTLLYLFIITV